MPGVLARVRSRLALGLLVVALTACSVDATVTVHMKANGSGTVSVRVVLDRAAVQAVEIAGGKLDDRIRLDDLTAAGWRVTPWRRAAAGGAAIVVSKPFTRPEQVRAIVREVNGSSGPLRGFGAARDGSTFSTHWRASGGADLRQVDLGVTQDPELLAALTAKRVDPQVLAARIAAQAGGALRVRTRLELPGASQELTVASGHRGVTAAAVDETAWGRIALLVAGVAAVLAALALVIVGEARARRRRSAPPRRIPRRGPEVAGPPSD